GIPVTKERLVKGQKDAVAAAEEIGYPVVIKATSPELTHKTEMDAIRLNLSDAKSVRQAVRELKESTKGQKIQGLLVQEMVKGQRELVTGLVRDPQFGPCVMFGLGGIYTEILRDVSFRVAPLTEQDALEMMDEIRGKKILESFRGMAAADRQVLAEVLVAMGRIGLDQEEVSEIDVNPLVLTKDGRPVAVDALVVLGEK
ncbi:MAG: acetate--CoA ligase family protein, partial [Desulfobacteraceae bacterium]